MKKVMIFTAIMLAASFSRAQWEPDVRLTSDPALSQTSLNNAWCIAASGDTVHVVWFDERDGNQEIYYKRSIDGGLTWGTDTRLTTNSGEETWVPSIALKGPVVYVFYEDWYGTNGDIFFLRSFDGGDTWDPSTRLTNDPVGSMFPSVAISDSIIHVTWQDERDNIQGDIFYKRSLDGGNTWSTDTNLSSEPAYSGIPSIAVWGENVHIVWEDYRDDNVGSIYYKRSTDGGITWGPDIRLTTSINDVWDPAIALNDSVVHVVFFDALSRDIYYKRSLDGGDTWEATKRLTNVAGYSRYSSIAVSGPLVHVTWEDSRDGNFEIYYKKSADGGVTWEPDLRLTTANYNSLQTSVAVSDSAVHVIWYDKRDFNDEIYYKRNPTGNAPVATGITGRVKTAGLLLYPNPAKTNIFIQINDEQEGELVLNVRNILGKTVLTTTLFNKENNIDISGLENGLYFVMITKPDMQFGSVKFVVNK